MLTIAISTKGETQMTRYTATISHHSISRARTVEVGDTLEAAKRNATREFGGDFLDYKIIIYDTTIENPWEAVVATRRIGNRRWATA